MVKGEFSFWDQKLCGDFLRAEKNSVRTFLGMVSTLKCRPVFHFYVKKIIETFLELRF